MFKSKRQPPLHLVPWPSAHANLAPPNNAGPMCAKAAGSRQSEFDAAKLEDKQSNKQVGSDDDDVDDDREYQDALKRVSRVLLPIVFLNGALAHFEKGNLAYAALQMNKQMGFTALEYGLGSGLYFLGYGLAILPSTFLTIKHGARRWVGAMTLVTGLLGMCHALIANKTGFYVLRCLLGLAEAGGGSSAGHLLAQFYPKDRLAQPFTVMMLSYFAAGVLAAPLATGLMSMQGLGGLQGWQWLFLLESVPSLIIGLVICVWLPSHPLTAWMLTPHQRELLHMKVHGSAAAADAARVRPRWSQLPRILLDTISKRPLLWFFTAVSLMHGMSFFSFHPWVTVIIQNMLAGTALHSSTASGSKTSAGGFSSSSGGSHPASGALPIKAILLTSVPALCGSLAAVVCAWHSERTKEQHLHVALPWALSGVLLGLFGPMVGLSFVAGFVSLVLAKTFSAAASGVMSSLLVGCLDTKHAGVGLALHHAVVASVAGFAGPVFVGALVQRTGSFGSAMILNGSLQVASALLMLGLACWSRGWLCCGSLKLRRSSAQQQQQRDKPVCVEEGERADGDTDTARLGSQALLGGAVLAACLPEEELPGTVPGLAVELSAVSLRREAHSCQFSRRV